MKYGNKERLFHFRRLVNPSAAEADIRLLSEKVAEKDIPQRYKLAPSGHHQEILFDLLGVCSREEIVINRRKYSLSDTESIQIGGKKGRKEKATKTSIKNRKKSTTRPKLNKEEASVQESSSGEKKSG